MKPSKTKDHLERVQPDKKNKNIEFFKVLKEEIRNQPNLKGFCKAPAKKAQSYTIGEEIVIPAIKEEIETVMKKDSEPVLKCIPLSAKTVQRRIDEMASDVEKTLVFELQHCKFSIQLDESAFGCSIILMEYVGYYSQSLKCIVDEFFLPIILKVMQRWLMMVHQQWLALQTDYRGFATLLKETVPDVRAVHCVLHRHHLVAKNLSGELHAAL
ncbi:Zinc finger MYM-type protein [Trichinella spiralis]|uniref:Zinc finger MYM-type protein n=1 Tax=Trichinella spiralis TaxID=6334 RepID=A0ABR3KVZ4_TRISP